MTHYGFGIVLFLTSWKLGMVRNRAGKVVFSIGPVRFCWHKVGAE